MRDEMWDYTEWDHVTIYAFDYWFEWMADTCFWSRNPSAQDQFGIGPVPPERLPLSATTATEIHHLAKWHDTALDWNDPKGASPWSQEECSRFNQASHSLYRLIHQELGVAFEISYAQRDEQVDGS